MPSVRPNFRRTAPHAMLPVDDMTHLDEEKKLRALWRGQPTMRQRCLTTEFALSAGALVSNHHEGAINRSLRALVTDPVMLSCVC